MNLKQIRQINFLILGIFVVLMLLLTLTLNPIFGYMAIAVIVADGIFLYKFWRCPKCDKNLGPIWITYCPNCGKKIN